MYYIARNQNEGDNKRVADKVTWTQPHERTLMQRVKHGQRNGIKLSFMQMQKTGKKPPTSERYQ